MVGKALKANAREQHWQDRCRSMYPVGWPLHHCRPRKTKFVSGVEKISIGQIFIIMLPPNEHTGPGSIHDRPDRREAERAIFMEMAELYEQTYGALDISIREYNSCLLYR